MRHMNIRNALYCIAMTHHLRALVPGVIPLPLIDSRRESESPVPVAKLKRHVIKSPSAARAAVASAFDGKAGAQQRPATARDQPSRSSRYQRSYVCGSTDPGWRLLSNRNGAGPTGITPERELSRTHDLSDSFMKRNIKQVPV
jgi:hypothetical protein